jgi:hypothetical protein
VTSVLLVGIHPRAELEHRAALFAALEEAFPSVRFEAREAGARSGLDALIDFGDGGEAGAAAAAGVRALAAACPEGDAVAATDVSYLDRPGLDQRLRGQTLPERHLPGAAAITVAAGAETLATAAAGALWSRQGRLDVVALSPLELAPGEPLRARLGGERSLALLPLLELLRELTAADRWQPPAQGAAFLLDDPNLHWPSYGYLKLPRLARHSSEHGYHLALAMVPLDTWFAHPTAARLLREQPSLSLLTHGNDHFGAELGAIEGEVEALAVAAQARRRIDAFEQRTGVAVSRVMVPPHEECSEAVARGLARVGFDAIAMTRPYPWLAPPPRHWLSAPSGTGALSGWRPADFTPGNLPVLLRVPFAEQHWSAAELALRAYLEQPLILYGHHEDLRDGLDVLAQRAAAINRLGPVKWSSLGDIAAASFEHRVEGELLRLRPYSRRIVAAVPEGVTHAVVEPAPGLGVGELVRGPGGTLPTAEPFPVSGSGSLTLTLEAPDAVAPDSVPAPPRRPWPLARRLASEVRDRAAPARDRVRFGR